VSEQDTEIAQDSPAPKAPSGKGYRSTLPGILGTLDNGISRIESFLLAAGVLLMAANVVANVVGRFVLGRSIQFSEELNQLLIIMITFAGISYAARHARHIRMSAIYDAMPQKARRVLMIVIGITTAGAACSRRCRFRCGPSSCGCRSASS
jgi:C4-dicarboxylate transporter, DctQ subunit